LGISIGILKSIKAISLLKPSSALNAPNPVPLLYLSCHQRFSVLQCSRYSNHRRHFSILPVLQPSTTTIQTSIASIASIASPSPLLLLSHPLHLSPFNTLSAPIKRVCTHTLYLSSLLTFSQFNRSVRVLLICKFTSFNFLSSSSISQSIRSSTRVGRLLLLVINGGPWFETGGMEPLRRW